MASALDELLLRGLTGRTPWKAECDACAVANVTRSGEQTIDGVALVAGDRVLLTNQTAPKDNGVFVVGTGSWDRAEDFASIATCRIGSTVMVARGTSNSGVYRMTVPTSGDVTPGVTATTWTKVAEIGTAFNVMNGEVLEFNPSHSATSNGAILDWAPLLPDYTTPANATGRSGAYTSAALVFSSSIDPSYEMTCGSVYDNGVAAAHVTAGTYMPILLMLHGYSGGTGSWADTERLLAADKGFFVITCAKRGNASTPHSAGGADDARDRQDIVDAIAAAVAAHPTFLDGVCVDIFGVSGGAYDGFTLVTRYPGRFRNCLLSQLGPDLGVSPEVDRSYWGSNDNRTEVEARVGTRASSIAPYRARNALTNLAMSLRQSTTKLFLLWDAQDPLGIAMRSAQKALEQGRVPRSQWYCEESDTGDTLRWEHGYPATVTDLLTGLNALFNRRSDPAPTCAETGEYIVTGHAVLACGIECWTADTGSTNCKNDATGGRDHVVRLIFDRRSGQAWVEPMSGACAVSVLCDGDILTGDIT